MQNTIVQFLQNVPAGTERRVLQTLFQAFARLSSCVALATAGLVIKAGGGVLAKVGSTAFYATVNGVTVTLAGSTDMPSLVGYNITAAKFNVICFFIDNAAAVTVLMGAEGATAAAVKWPDFPSNKALVGVLLVTHSSAFTGGTTALDTATTVYLSPVGAFDPSLLFS